MDATAPLSTRARDRPAIAQQMNRILQEEIAGGALANIATATRVWSAHRRDHVVPGLTRRLATEFSDFLNPVLDLIAPVQQPAAQWQLPPTEPAEPPPEGKLVESVPVLRARRPGAPGGTVGIRTALQNEGPAPVEAGFRWSDLVAEDGGHIRAACLRLLPCRLTVPPGVSADLVIDLSVPDDATSGEYHTLLETTDRGGSRALLIFRIGRQNHQEARSPGDAVWGRG
jgi:hypothetical protein